jgi:hypothetical protein
MAVDVPTADDGGAVGVEDVAVRVADCGVSGEAQPGQPGLGLARTALSKGRPIRAERPGEQGLDGFRRRGTHPTWA